MKNRLLILLQYLLPHHLLSRWVGLIAASENRRLSQWLIKCFCKYYPVNLAEAERDNITDYVSVQDFFIRQLKPGARPIPQTPGSIISPVDGVISEFGGIQQQTLIQAKGRHYTLPALLGDEARAATFTDGQFMTIYLAPQDYHRVHMPITGKLTHMTYIPGRLFSVQSATMQHIDSLLARNERVICYFDTCYGSMAVILVGAMLVASIATAWHSTITPSKATTPQHWEYPNEEITLTTGAQLGYFNFGSTVILLFNHPDIHWQLTNPSHTTRLGQIIYQPGNI
jgi:phosphatidylserine decarboxylase